MEKNVGSNVSCMKVSGSERNLVATGGKENELKVWDLQKLKNAVFAAKNVCNFPALRGYST
jgi:ribosome biogenesis protein NSA1